MMKRILLLCCLLALAVAPAPVRAQPGWEQGTYTGWVYLTARLDKTHKIDMQGATVRQDTVVYWQAHGDMTVRIEAGGQGFTSVYLPFEITGQENGFYTLPNGSCSFNILGLGQAVIQDLAWLSARPLGDAFDTGLVVPPVSARVGRKSVTGDQCGNLDQTALFINDTLKNTTGKITAIKFNVGYRTPLSVGGACELADWAMTMPIQNGSISRDLLDCTWRVFREPGE